jgi:acetylxylan esterase
MFAFNAVRTTHAVGAGCPPTAAQDVQARAKASTTPQQWGALVRNADPGYTGPRPRMQLWHGTADATLNYNNFGKEIKQWTNALGVSQTPTSTDTPQPAGPAPATTTARAPPRSRRTASQAPDTSSRSPAWPPTRSTSSAWTPPHPGDQKITNAWNTTLTQSGTSVTAVNLSYNAAISPGAATSLGFQGTWATNDTSPTSFSFNGTPCT